MSSEMIPYIAEKERKLSLILSSESGNFEHPNRIVNKSLLKEQRIARHVVNEIFSIAWNITSKRFTIEKQMFKSTGASCNYVLLSISDHFGMFVCFGEYLHSVLRRIIRKISKQLLPEAEGQYHMGIKLKTEKEKKKIWEMRSKSSKKLLEI